MNRSWILLPPSGQVPDGGATVTLLGAALGVVGVVRRYTIVRGEPVFVRSSSPLTDSGADLLAAGNEGAD